MQCAVVQVSPPVYLMGGGEDGREEVGGDELNDTVSCQLTGSVGRMLHQFSHWRHTPVQPARQLERTDVQ